METFCYVILWASGVLNIIFFFRILYLRRLITKFEKLLSRLGDEIGMYRGEAELRKQDIDAYKREITFAYDLIKRIANVRSQGDTKAVMDMARKLLKDKGWF